jgi:hypothetical protein
MHVKQALYHWSQNTSPTNSQDRKRSLLPEEEKQVT